MSVNDVLISIRPEWCAKIINGEKVIEVRKTKPKLDTPFKCYIYCTKPKRKGANLYRYCWGGTTQSAEITHTKLSGKVIGEFVCDEIIEAKCGEYCLLPPQKTQIDAIDLCNYADGKTIYGLSISNLVIYDEPKGLSEFYTECCPYLHNKTCYNNELCAYQEYNEHGDIKPCVKEVKRPPQSWCYLFNREVQE